MYRLSFIPAELECIWRFEVICAGVIATFPFPPFYRTLGDRKPDLCARAQGMDAAACRSSTVAVTAQILRQSVFLLTTIVWEDSRSVSPKRKFEIIPPSPDICNTCAATTTSSSKSFFITWNATQESRHVPGHGEAFYRCR